MLLKKINIFQKFLHNIEKGLCIKKELDDFPPRFFVPSIFSFIFQSRQISKFLFHNFLSYYRKANKKGGKSFLMQKLSMMAAAAAVSGG